MESAQHWIERLDLQPHPEGGWYRQTYRASLMLPHAALPGYGGDRAASTAIYFLLAGDQFSALHRLHSDEVWHFYAGSGLIVHVIDPGGTYSVLLLGNDAARASNSRPSCPQAAGSAPRYAIRIATRSSAAPSHRASTSQTSRWQNARS
jgi:predicted cupin superfamily sugar epimerase